MMKCIILCVSYMVIGSIASPVSFIKPCTQTDSDCILNSARIVLSHMVNGIPEIGVPSLDPLTAQNVVANAGQFVMHLNNVVAHGLSKCRINKIERDPVKSTVTMDIECPVSINGNYSIDGKLFDLDIGGEGPFIIKGGELHVIITAKLKQNTKEGKKYYKIGGFDYKYEPISQFTFKFDNLFHGDKSKADIVHQILNEGWKGIIMDPNIGKPLLKEALVQLVNIIDKLLQAIPVEELEIVNE